MTFDEYAMLALRTNKWREDRTLNLSHAILGLVTETGEATTQIKRHVIYGKELTPEMLENLKEELGDVLWYAALACRVVMTTYGEALEYVAKGPESGPQCKLESLESCIHLWAIAVGTLATGIYREAFVPGEPDDGFLSKWSVVTAVNVTFTIAKILGFDVTEIMQMNLDKLRKRYPDEYSDEAAELRADKQGE